MTAPVCPRVDNVDSTSQEKVISLAHRDVCRIRSDVGSICTVDFASTRPIQNEEVNSGEMRSCQVTDHRKASFEQASRSGRTTPTESRLKSYTDELLCT
jgi:hypothetical protein